MDLSIIRQYFFEEKYADFELILDDGIDKIVMKVHKLVLACHSPYFDKMFHFNNNCKSSETMKVNSAIIMKHIILSFYEISTENPGYPDWYYLLETHLCKNYLCISCDLLELYSLEVPPEGFDLLVRVLEHHDISANQKLIRLLRKNLPENYDKSTLPPRFLSELSKPIYELAVGTRYGDINIIDINVGDLLGSFDTNDKDMAHNIKNINMIHSIKITSDNKKIISTCDNAIKIWDANTYQLLDTLLEHTKLVYKIAISFDNKYIVSGSYDKTIKIWDLNNGICLRTLLGHVSHVRCVTISEDNKFIASSEENYGIKIWDTSSGLCIKTLDKYSSDHLNFLPNNKLIIHRSSAIIIFDIDKSSLRQIEKNTSNNDVIWSSDVSHNGQFSITGSYGKIVEVIDMDRFSYLHKLDYHSCSVRAIAISADDKLLATASEVEIILWDLYAGTPIKTIKGEYAFCMAFKNNIVSTLK